MTPASIRREQSQAKGEAAQQKLELEFNASLDEVDNLSEDRVLRLYLDLVRATLRTNFFQRDVQGQPKPYISVKLDPAKIPDVPLPLPMFEIFVYSPRVEGCTCVVARSPGVGCAGLTASRITVPRYWGW